MLKEKLYFRGILHLDLHQPDHFQKIQSESSQKTDPGRTKPPGSGRFKILDPGSNFSEGYNYAKRKDHFHLFIARKS